jgi:hypothetical protein
VRWGGPRRATAYAEALADISSPDVYLLGISGPIELQVGGTFMGVVIPYEVVQVTNGTTIRVSLGDIGGVLAQQVSWMWFSVMVQRTHAELQIKRAHTRHLRPPDGQYNVL